jgi:hypothetical protein
MIAIKKEKEREAKQKERRTLSHDDSGYSGRKKVCEGAIPGRGAEQPSGNDNASGNSKRPDKEASAKSDQAKGSEEKQGPGRIKHDDRPIRAVALSFFEGHYTGQ